MSWDNFPEELVELGDVLGGFGETQPTAEALWSATGDLKSSWRLSRSMRSSTAIPVPVPRNKALFPAACEVEVAEMNFVFELGQNIGEDLIPARSDFQVCVRGCAIYEKAAVELEDHWRVDTHVHVEGALPWEPHSIIHFQRGGHAQDAFASSAQFVPGRAMPENLRGENWLSLLQSPGPRVPFPPFCPILAIDYTIGQHDGRLFRKLRNVPEYSRIVRKAQQRLWLPFFDALSRNAVVRNRWLGDLLVDSL